MKRLFFWMMVALPLLGKAQVWVPGFVVTQAGDTLEGFICEGSGKTIGYRPDRNATPHWYKEKDLTTLSTGDETYVLLTVEVLRGKFPERVHDRLEVVENGPVQLLRYNGLDLYGGEHLNLYVRRGNGTAYRVPEDKGPFRKTMSGFFGDNSDLVSKIEAGEMGYELMDEIVRQYNAAKGQ